MENVLSLLTSLDDYELQTIIVVLSEYAKTRHQPIRRRIMSKNVMTELISKRLEETKPIYETPDSFEQRKRDAKWYVQCELV